MKKIRKPDYTVERAVHGENFKKQVLYLITGQYEVSQNDAEVAFKNCMTYGYAVIQPVSEKYPKGIMMATDVYKQKVLIG